MLQYIHIYILEFFETVLLQVLWEAFLCFTVILLITGCICWCLGWQRSCISPTGCNVGSYIYFLFSLLRQAWDQTERTHLLPGDWRSLLRSPPQCDQGKHLFFFSKKTLLSIFRYRHAEFTYFQNSCRFCTFFKQILIYFKKVNGVILKRSGYFYLGKFRVRVLMQFFFL